MNTRVASAEARNDIGLVRKPTEHAGASLGRLIEDDRAVFALPNSLGRQFGFLKLKQLLATPLEDGILQGSFQDGIGPQFGSHQSQHKQHVLRSLHSKTDNAQAEATAGDGVAHRPNGRPGRHCPGWPRGGRY